MSTPDNLDAAQLLAAQLLATANAQPFPSTTTDQASDVNPPPPNDPQQPNPHIDEAQFSHIVALNDLRKRKRKRSIKA